MPSRISSDQLRFATDAINSNGAIDTDHLSPELQTALADAGMSTAPLTRLAGADHRLDSANDVGALANIIEQFPAEPEAKASLRSAFLEEFGRHSVKTLTAADALVVGDGVVSLVGEVKLNVPGVNQFDLGAARGVSGDALCFDAAVAQLEGFFKNQKKPVPPLATKPDAIQIALHETTSGRIEADTGKALQARDYIDDCLYAHRPVLVGVSVLNVDQFRHNEGITEHFLTVSGRGVDPEGRLFYAYRDPGNQGDAGKLYVDPDSGKLFKPGMVFGQGAGVVADMLYEVTQVRTYKDLPVR